MHFLLVDFEDYTSQYVIGAKKISIRTKRPKVLKDPVDIKMEKALWDSDLFFDKGGLLIYSSHFDQQKRYKITYGYDHRRKLVSVMSVLAKTNVLLARSEFVYDQENRIKKEISFSYHYGEEQERYKTEYVHQYKEKEEIIEVEGGTESHRINIRYDEQHRVVEDKAVNKDGHLLWWYKKNYDAEGKLLTEVFLNKEGKPEVTYQFLPQQNGLASGYIFQSRGRSYKREYEYTFNNRGHWISRVMLDDGDPKYFYERKISYY